MGLEAVADPGKKWYSAIVDDSKKSPRSSLNGLNVSYYTKKATTGEGPLFLCRLLEAVPKNAIMTYPGKSWKLVGVSVHCLDQTSKKSISIGEASQRKKTFVTSVFSDGFFPAQWYNENRRRRDHLTTSEGHLLRMPFPLIATYYKSSIERKKAEKVA